MDVTNGQYLKSWLLFFLVGTVGGTVFGMMVGGALGALLGMAGAPLLAVPPVVASVEFPLCIFVSFLAFRWSVRTYIVGPALGNVGHQTSA